MPRKLRSGTDCAAILRLKTAPTLISVMVRVCPSSPVRSPKLCPLIRGTNCHFAQLLPEFSGQFAVPISSPLCVSIPGLIYAEWPTRLWPCMAWTSVLCMYRRNGCYRHKWWLWCPRLWQCSGAPLSSVSSRLQYRQWCVIGQCHRSTSSVNVSSVSLMHVSSFFDVVIDVFEVDVVNVVNAVNRLNRLKLVFNSSLLWKDWLNE